MANREEAKNEGGGASGLSRENALNHAIRAVAAGDFELSRILDAEGKKLRYVAGDMPGSRVPQADFGQVLQVNESVRTTLQAIMNLQMISSQKLSGLLSQSGPEPEKQTDLL